MASNIIIHGLRRLFLRIYRNDTTDPLYFWVLHVPAYSQKRGKFKKYYLLHSPLRSICTYVFTILPFTYFTHALQITKNNKNTDFYIYCEFDRAIHFIRKTKKC